MFDIPILQLNHEQVRIPKVSRGLARIIFQNLHDDSRPSMEAIVIRISLVREVHPYFVTLFEPAHVLYRVCLPSDRFGQGRAVTVFQNFVSAPQISPLNRVTGLMEVGKSSGRVISTILSQSPSEFVRKLISEELAYLTKITQSGKVSLDYWQTALSPIEYSQKEWAAVRGVQRQTVNDSIRMAEAALKESLPYSGGNN